MKKTILSIVFVLIALPYQLASTAIEIAIPFQGLLVNKCEAYTLTPANIAECYVRWGGKRLDAPKKQSFPFLPMRSAQRYNEQ